MTIDRHLASATLLTGALALTGCNQVMLPDLTTTGSVFGAAEKPAYTHTIAENRPVGEAFATLPSVAGAPLTLSQKRFGNGLEQTIVYPAGDAGRGENRLDVKMVTNDESHTDRSEPSAITTVTDRQIIAEMRKAFPGVSMRIASSLTRNAYGPFGYATGEAAGLNCLYGWQQMRGRKAEGRNWFARTSTRPQLSLRLRICRDDLSREQLAGLMRDLRIHADPAALARVEQTAWSAGPAVQSEAMFANSVSGGYRSTGPVAAAPVGVNVAPVRASKPVRKRSTAPVRTTPQQLVSRPVVTPDGAVMTTLRVPTPQNVGVVANAPATTAVETAVVTKQGGVPLPPDRNTPVYRVPEAGDASLTVAQAKPRTGDIPLPPTQ